MRRTPILLLVALAWAALGCGGAESLVACEAADGLTPVCGFDNPEDLATLPGSAWIVASEFGVEGTRPGGIAALRISDRQRVRLYPSEFSHAAAMGAVPATDGRFGDADCPGPPDAERFHAHGLDVRSGIFGTDLAVVNHGGREAVEFFELGYAQGGPTLFWRGCTALPEGAWGNDVAFLPDQGLVLTNMMPPPSGLAAVASVVRMLLGRDTGSVLRWHPESGWEELEESAGSGPNGIAVSPDGSEIFFSEWSGQRLVRLRLDGEPRRSQTELPHHPDNLTWSRDGRLLVTGQVGGLGAILGCGSIESGTCALPFSVFAVEPASLETELVLEHSASSTGAGSVALQVGSSLWLGTFAGDRLASLAYPE